jgi:hypothetical protein
MMDPHQEQPYQVMMRGIAKNQRLKIMKTVMTIKERTTTFQSTLTFRHCKEMVGSPGHSKMDYYGPRAQLAHPVLISMIR